MVFALTHLDSPVQIEPKSAYSCRQGVSNETKLDGFDENSGVGGTPII